VIEVKRREALKLLVHPPQPPDLNPIEAIWNIIKQRLRDGSWKTVDEFKAAIRAEWDKITIKELRRRVSEMRWRCKRIIELQGDRIKSELWRILCRKRIYISEFDEGWSLRGEFSTPVHTPK
jgi:hypothetical protein